MNKSLLALASLMVAGVAMAADGGTFTFKSYLSANNNLKVVLSSGDPVATPDWYMGLVDANKNLLMGTKGSALGALVPVVAPFSSVAAGQGYVTSGGDWSVAGINQGASAQVMLAVFKGADFATGDFKTYSSLYSLNFGGNELSPPVVAGKFDFAGAQTLTVMIPEPSVFALGLLGLGAFLIRRRS